MQVTQPATDPTPIPLPGTATLLLAAILAWLITFAQRLNPRRLLAALLMLAMLPAHAVERIEYIHSDPLGSPIAATDENGEVLWRVRYPPYGSRELKQAPARDRLWFTGKAEETILGLQDFGARWYDPTAGRFISMDPVGFTESNLQSFNRYAYANNNAYRYVDPDGQMPVLPLLVLGLTATEIATSDVPIVGGSAVKTGVRAASAVAELGSQSSLKSATGVSWETAKEITLSRSIHGEAAAHAADAIKAGKPSTLTIDRTSAAANRKASIGALDKVAGKHLDEYPPARFKEGGAGSSVRPINPRDNMSAGACIGNACRGLPDGTRVQIRVGD